MDGWMPAALTVGDFAAGEDALEEPLAITLDRRRDARNVCGVEAKTDDVGHSAMILPSPDPPFVWRHLPAGAALVCEPLEQLAPHFFTTRQWTLGADGLNRQEGQARRDGQDGRDGQGRRDGQDGWSELAQG